MDASNVTESHPLPLSPTVGSGVPHHDTASSALSALARFEFQNGKGNEGTKILMVEWDPSSLTSSAPPSSSAAPRTWQVSWEGKTNHLPVDDGDTVTSKRVYFLLPPGAAVPPKVTITDPNGTIIATNPLPAIFPPGLGAGSSDVGTRGVLHTIWAKKRLSELQDEIDAEMKTNAESVGLEIAIQERQWITEQFGVPLRTHVGASASQTLPSPISPRSPGGRLGEKLKGLRLATSAADLAVGPAGKDEFLHPISFSPAVGDVAVSSYSKFARQTPPRPTTTVSTSLDAILSTTHTPLTEQQNQDPHDDLFALPMSPRSPEMARSPFSLG